MSDDVTDREVLVQLDPESDTLPVVADERPIEDRLLEKVLEALR